jgi:hypothetical protein
LWISARSADQITSRSESPTLSQDQPFTRYIAEIAEMSQLNILKNKLRLNMQSKTDHLNICKQERQNSWKESRGRLNAKSVMPMKASYTIGHHSIYFQMQITGQPLTFAALATENGMIL